MMCQLKIIFDNTWLQSLQYFQFHFAINSSSHCLGVTSEKGDFLIDPKNNRTTSASFADASIDYIQNGGMSADVLDIRGPTSDEMNVKVTKNQI